MRQIYTNRTLGQSKIKSQLIIFASSLSVALAQFTFVSQPAEAAVVSLGSGDCIQQADSLTGAVVREGNYCLVAIKGPAVFTGTSGTWTVPNGVNQIEYLLVGGGGAGGFSGGGGAGGFFETSSPVAAAAGTQISVAVGAGGATGSRPNAANNGSQTTFGVVSVGGGGGGDVLASEAIALSTVARATGHEGSGGGAMATNFTVISGNQSGNAGNSSLTPKATVQGQSAGATGNVNQSRNAGGSALQIFTSATVSTVTKYGSFIGGGGGGGAGAPGGDEYWSNSVTDICNAASGKKICFAPGNGGDGLPSGLIGQSASQTALGIGQYVSGRTYFAGGGGGKFNFDSATFASAYYGTFSYNLSGSGGKGGGGLAADGAANTGGGGAGLGKAGGSGVVLIRYVIPQVSNLTSIAASATEINLGWTPPTGTETITGYKIEKSLQGANNWTTSTTIPDLIATAGSSTKVTGLSANTNYDFRVTPKFASGEGIKSSIGTTSTNRNVQIVSWSPTNIVLTNSDSPITPSALARTDGDGTISYGIQNTGTTNCAVNSATGVLTFTAAGTCVVRASASQTSTYASGYTDVTFTVTTPSAVTAPSTTPANTATPTPTPSPTKKAAVKKKTTNPAKKSTTPTTAPQIPMNSLQPSATPKPSASKTSVPMNSQSPSTTPIAPKSEFKQLSAAPYPGAGIDVPDSGKIIATLNSVPIGSMITTTAIDTKVALTENQAVVIFTQSEIGESLPLNGNGVIQVEDNSKVFTEVTGFAPNTPVEVWVFSYPTRLGGGYTNETGDFTGQFALSNALPAGDHTLQLNGLDASGKIISVAIGINKQSKTNPIGVADSRELSAVEQAGAVAFGILIFTILLLAFRRRRSN